MIAIMYDLIAELRRLPGRSLRSAAGDIIFRRGDAIRRLHVIETGSAALMRFSATGAPIIMQRARAGMVLAESSLFSDRYHCDGVSQSDVVAHSVSVQTVRRRMAEDAGFGAGLSAYLAREVQRMRIRAEVLAIRKVGERLDAWLALTGDALPARGGWRQLADELGVSPEALYREMAMRRQGRVRPS